MNESNCIMASSPPAGLPFVLVISGIVLASFCLFMAWWHWRKLWAAHESDDNLNDSKNEKGGSKPIKPLGEINQAVCLLDQPIRLLLHPKRCLLLLLGKNDVEAGNMKRDEGDSFRAGLNAAVLVGQIKRPKLLKNLMRFRTHIHGKMPNSAKARKDCAHPTPS
jgi:hypothetical protein